MAYRVTPISTAYHATNGAFGVFYDGINIWVTDPATTGTIGYVVKIDAASGLYVDPAGNLSPTLSDGQYQVGSGSGWRPGAVCGDGTYIWVINTNVHQICKLRMSDGVQVAAYGLGANTFPYNASMVFDGTYLWTQVQSASGTLLRVRVSDGAQTIFNYGHYAKSVAYDSINSCIWVVGDSNQSSPNNFCYLTKVSLAGVVLADYPIGTTQSVYSVATDGSYLWISHNYAGGQGNALVKMRCSDGAFIKSDGTVGSVAASSISPGLFPYWGVTYHSGYFYASTKWNIVQIQALPGGVTGTINNYALPSGSAGFNPFWLAYGDNAVWATNYDGNVVYMVELFDQQLLAGDCTLTTPPTDSLAHIAELTYANADSFAGDASLINIQAVSRLYPDHGWNGDTVYVISPNIQAWQTNDEYHGQPLIGWAQSTTGDASITSGPYGVEILAGPTLGSVAQLSAGPYYNGDWTIEFNITRGTSADVLNGRFIYASIEFAIPLTNWRVTLSREYDIATGHIYNGAISDEFGVLWGGAVQTNSWSGVLRIIRVGRSVTLLSRDAGNTEWNVVALSRVWQDDLPGDIVVSTTNLNVYQVAGITLQRYLLNPGIMFGLEPSIETIVAPSDIQAIVPAQPGNETRFVMIEVYSSIGVLSYQPNGFEYVRPDKFNVAHTPDEDLWIYRNDGIQIPDRYNIEQAPGTRLTGIVLTPMFGSYELGQHVQYTVLAQYNGNVSVDVTNQCNWNTTDVDGYISPNGLMSFGSTAGRYYITATYQGFSQTAIANLLTHQSSIAQTARLDKHTSIRFAEISTLDAARGPRFAQTARLNRGFILAGTAKLVAYASAQIAQFADVSFGATPRFAQTVSGWNIIKTASFAQLAKWYEDGSGRFAQTATLAITLARRFAQTAHLTGSSFAHIANLAVTAEARFASDQGFAYQQISRFAGLAQFIRNRTVRFAQAASLDAHISRGIASTATLTAAASARFAEMATLSHTARFAGLALLPMTASQAFAGVTRLTWTGATRSAEISILEAHTSLRFAEISKLDATGTRRIASISSLTYIATDQLAELATLQVSTSRSLAGACLLTGTVAVRLAGTTAFDKHTTATIAHTISLVYPGSERLAEKATLNATTTSPRFASKATLEASASTRFAETSLLSITTDNRFANIATPEFTTDSTMAGIAIFDKHVTTRFAGTSAISVTLAARVAGIADLENANTSRFAQTITLEYTVPERGIAGTANLEAHVTTLLAESATLTYYATPTLAGISTLVGSFTSRMASSTAFDRHVLAPIAQKATLNAATSAIIAHIATLNNSGTDLLAQYATLNATVTPRMAQLSSLEASTQATIAQLADFTAVDAQRIAGIATIHYAMAVRISGLSTLAATTYQLFAGLADMSAVGSDRFASDTAFDQNIVVRFAEISSLDAPASARFAQTATFVATITPRVAGLASLIVGDISRIAQLSALDASTTRRISSRATLLASATRLFAETSLLAITGTPRVAGLSSLNATVTPRMAGTSTLQGNGQPMMAQMCSLVAPLNVTITYINGYPNTSNVIPLSAQSVSHIGFSNTGSLLTYTGPTWTAGPDNSGLSVVPKTTLFGGTAEATGLTGWSGRKYFKLTPNTSNAITASYASNFMYTFIFSPPSQAGGAWGGDPYGNYDGPFLFDLGIIANGGSGKLELDMLARGTSPWPLRIIVGTNSGTPVGTTAAMNIATPGPHVLTVSQGTQSSIWPTIRFKFDNNPVQQFDAAFPNFNISGGGTFLGSSSYYGLQDNATQTNSWSNGVIYEARFCTMPSLVTNAQLDALHASIMI